MGVIELRTWAEFYYLFTVPCVESSSERLTDFWTRCCDQSLFCVDTSFVSTLFERCSATLASKHDILHPGAGNAAYLVVSYSFNWFVISVKTTNWKLGATGGATCGHNSDRQQLTEEASKRWNYVTCMVITALQELSEVIQLYLTSQLHKRWQLSDGCRHYIAAVRGPGWHKGHWRQVEKLRGFLNGWITQRGWRIRIWILNCESTRIDGS